MNLSDLRNAIQDISDWHPDNVSYQQFVDRVINLALQEIWTTKPWTFATEQKFLDIYPPIDGQTLGIQLLASNMSRLITFSADVELLGYPHYHRTWAGQIITIEDRDYTILQVSNENTIILAEPFRVQNSSDTHVIDDWKIKHPTYRLPQEATQLLNFYQMDRPINSRNPSWTTITPIGQNINYRTNQEGDVATYVCLEPSLRVPPAHKISMEVSGGSAPSDQDGIPDGTWVEFAWAFRDGDFIGPLSDSVKQELSEGGGSGWNTVEITCLTANNKEVKLETRSQLEIPYPPSPAAGLEKVLFFNINIDPDDGTTMGNPCWVQVKDFKPDGAQMEYQQLAALSSSSTIEVLYDGCLDAMNTRYVSGPVLRIRPYPTIVSGDVSYPASDLDGYASAPAREFRQVMIQYAKQPKELVLDQDEPDLPPEFHQLIVYKALQNIFVRKNEFSLAPFYEQKYQVEIQKLFGSYTTPAQHGNIKFGQRGSNYPAILKPSRLNWG